MGLSHSLPLPPKIRQECKYLQVSNELAYCAKAKKKFYEVEMKGFFFSEKILQITQMNFFVLSNHVDSTFYNILVVREKS
jgi:hypothetical protein